MKKYAVYWGGSSYYEFEAKDASHLKETLRSFFSVKRVANGTCWNEVETYPSIEHANEFRKQNPGLIPTDFL